MNGRRESGTGNGSPRPIRTHIREAGSRPCGRASIRVEGQPGHRGFTLVELLVVAVIISMLITLLVSGVWKVRQKATKVEVQLTLQQMKTGLISMKSNYDYASMLGVYSTGRTTAAGTVMTDSGTGRDFSTWVDEGDTLYLVSGKDRGGRNVTGVAGTSLTVGAAFDHSDTDLYFFVLKPDGTTMPPIEIAKELNPGHPEWVATFTPHLNGRKRLYYNGKPKRIKNGNLFDSYGQPYYYRLVPDGDVVREVLISSGPDAQLGTADDVEEEVRSVPIGG